MGKLPNFFLLTTQVRNKMLIRRRISVVLAAAAAALLALTSTTAHALVTFDSSSGTGFVGKGDVQTAFGWNNAQLQANAGSVTFTVEAQVARYQDCIDDGNPANATRYPDVRTQVRDLDATVTSDARLNRNQTVQTTGFLLEGYAGEPQYVGGIDEAVACPTGTHAVGGWTDWEAYGTAGAGVFAHYGSVTVPLG